MIIETITHETIELADGDQMDYDREKLEVIITRKGGSVEKYPITVAEVEV